MSWIVALREIVKLAQTLPAATISLG